MAETPQTSASANSPASKSDQPFDRPNFYPKLRIDHIENPSRLWAIPLFGFLIKFIILIPVFIELMFIGIALWFVWVINSFIVLFTGEYWDEAYTFNLGVMRLSTKLFSFYFGLTDKYPGFDFAITDSLISLDITKPQNPSRLFAIPVLGFFIRIILLIPYLIYETVLRYGAWIGVFFSFFPVLFMGKYPESSYELARDSQRVSLGSTAYMAGLSDSYPSFWISMNHKPIKILLIVVAALYLIFNFTNSFINGFNKGYYRSNTNYYNQQNYNQQNYNQQYYNQPNTGSQQNYTPQQSAPQTQQYNYQ